MILYVPINELNLFLQILKDFPNYDDYMLDGERLGKQKIIFNKNFSENQFFEEIFPYLPLNSMLVFSAEKTKDTHILCVGDIDFHQLHYLSKLNIVPTIFTKTGDRIRLNVLVPYETINNIFQDGLIQNFNTINGEIDEYSLFLLETDYIDELLSIISRTECQYIIKNNKIFVNLSLKFFCDSFHEISPLIEKLDIVSKGDF